MRDAGHLAGLMRRCHAAGVPVTVIGAGSNSLVLDGGIRGLVVELPRGRLRRLSADVIELPGGAMMPRAALDCAAEGLGGLEFGIGVPGTCGASVRGNAGAFGTEIKDVLIDCDTLAPDGSEHVLRRRRRSASATATPVSSTTSQATSSSPPGSGSMRTCRPRSGP